MPRKLVSDMYNGYMSKMKENMGIGKTEGVQAAPAEDADNAQAGPAQAAGGAMPAAPGAAAAPLGGATGAA
jgi:hypothetical protein